MPVLVFIEPSTSSLIYKYVIEDICKTKCLTLSRYKDIKCRRNTRFGSPQLTHFNLEVMLVSLSTNGL
jgi:hypothetical protein